MDEEIKKDDVTATPPEKVKEPKALEDEITVEEYIDEKDDELEELLDW